LWLILTSWCDNKRLVKKPWGSVKQLQCLDDVFTLFQYMLKIIGYEFLNVLKGILYSLNYFQTYPNARLIYDVHHFLKHTIKK